MISLAAGLTLRRNVLSDAAVDHIVGLVPADDSSWVPCIGQVEEFASKRCTLIPVDADVQRSLAAISTTFGVDTSALDMLPIIRYLPGAPPVGVHGDVGADGLVPNRTLVTYLTDADAPGSGETFFPALNVSVAPARGAVLGFDNTDAAGAPDPTMRHGVTAVAAAATRDRLVIQIPILAGKAYAEHVSGSKHVIHMGLMGSVAAGFGVWKLYQYDETFGMAAGAAVIVGALALVWWKMRQAPATAHADAVDCCADEAAVCGRLAQHMKNDDAVEMEAGSGVTVLQVNGINCGGCKKSLAAALVGVDGVKEFSIETKADTGKHPNKVEVRGGSADAIRDAIVALDAGRGKFTIA